MRIQFYDTITERDPDGTMKALAGVTVRVFNKGLSTRPNVWAREADTAPIPGSEFITVDGVMDFWVDPGSYDIRFEDTVSPPRVDPLFKITIDMLPASVNTLPGSVLEDVSITENKIAELLGSSFATVLMNKLFAPGDMKTSYQPADHSGWLLCNGRNDLAVADYPALGALMQARGFAGIDINHFAIPDYTGRVPVGANPANAVISSLISHDSIAAASRKPHHSHSKSLTADNKATGVTVSGSGGHSHGISDPGHSHTLGGGGGTLAVFDTGGVTWVAPPWNAGSQSYWQPATNGYHSQIAMGTDGAGVGVGVTGDGSHGHGISDPLHNHSVSGSVGDTTGPQDVVPYHTTNFFIKI